MMDLQCTHPDVHAAFMKGLFPARRTDGAWTGMFKNLFIESVLMAGLKSTGGLTRGRGFNESTRLLFLLSRAICAEISQSIFEIAWLSSDEEMDIVSRQLRAYSVTCRIQTRCYKSFWNVEC